MARTHSAHPTRSTELLLATRPRADREKAERGARVLRSAGTAHFALICLHTKWWLRFRA